MKTGSLIWLVALSCGAMWTMKRISTSFAAAPKTATSTWAVPEVAAPFAAHQTATSALAAPEAAAPQVAAPAAPVESWDFQWTPARGEVAPKVEICPFKYGKTWAYSVEIDDGPASTLSVVAPLLESYGFSDAPPGMTGGKVRPFVGGAAIFLLRFDTGNSTLLSVEDAKHLRERGWGMLNHSYWHSGVHWDKAKANHPEDWRRELYWSQSLWPALLGEGRAATHFVLPNGDAGYEPFAAQFGLASASRVGASSPRRVDDKTVWLDLDRNYLDEGVWAKANNALSGLPESPKAGDFIIDFTHGIDAPGSVNYGRWQTRLEHIAGKWGAGGDGSLWCAPTDSVVNYARAAKAARVSTKAGNVHVDFPADLPGSALTLHLQNLDQSAKLTAPLGGTLFRRGNEAWVTTPVLGQVGAKPPAKLKRVFRGPLGDVKLDAPCKIAGIRVLQSGDVGKEWKMSLQLVGANGETTELVRPDKATLPAQWGSWLLFPAVPDRAAILAQEIRAPQNRALSQMEVWALDESR